MLPLKQIQISTGLNSLSPSNNASKSSRSFMAVVLLQNQVYSIGPLVRVHCSEVQTQYIYRLKL